jgi:collagenase-like PrtC family protease
MTLKSPELLLPAGSLDRMRAAYDFGADAVYAGQPRYSAARAQQRIPHRADSNRHTKRPTRAARSSF